MSGRDADTIPHLARAAAARFGSAEAVIGGALRLSFVELAAGMMRAAAAFVAAGLRPGDRVGLWAPNSADWITACLGIQAAGGILVPLNTRFRGAEAQFILNRSRARFLVTVGAFLGTDYPALLHGLDPPALERRIILQQPGPEGWAAFLDQAGPESHAEAERRLDRLSADDVSDIIFTSGTTGDPKGVVTGHGQTVAVARLWAAVTTLGARDRFLILWPFFHCSGYKAGWVACLAVGAAILPEPALDVPRLVETVRREAVTFLPGPPTLFQTLLAMPDRPPGLLAAIRVSITGAASVAPALIEAMRQELGIPMVLTGYGLTEACGTCTMTGPDDSSEIVTTSCGRALDGIELRVVDTAGRDVPLGTEGEILCRGMNVMRGYFDDEAATRAAIDDDGWLHTGDIGTLDAAGYLRITDRKKDMYICGGFNCYPAEIEKILLQHPAIAQVAVAGTSDPRMGEVGIAYVVTKSGALCSAEEIIAWSRNHMANYKAPRQVVFLPSLPTNATGKVQKFLLPTPRRVPADVR